MLEFLSFGKDSLLPLVSIILLVGAFIFGWWKEYKYESEGYIQYKDFSESRIPQYVAAVICSAVFAFALCVFIIWRFEEVIKSSETDAWFLFVLTCIVTVLCCGLKSPILLVRKLCNDCTCVKVVCLMAIAIVTIMVIDIPYVYNSWCLSYERSDALVWVTTIFMVVGNLFFAFSLFGKYIPLYIIGAVISFVNYCKERDSGATFLFVTGLIVVIVGYSFRYDILPICPSDSYFVDKFGIVHGSGCPIREVPAFAWKRKKYDIKLLRGEKICNECLGSEIEKLRVLHALNFKSYVERCRIGLSEKEAEEAIAKYSQHCLLDDAW